MEKGRIRKGIGGFYYVETDQGILECRARGIFRNKSQKPYVGDMVMVTRNEDGSGNIEEILPRTSLLLRPPVANATQAIAVFSWIDPKLNATLLHRMLLAGEQKGLRMVVCFNKSELMKDADRRMVTDWFKNTGYPILFTSVAEETNLDLLVEELKGHISLLAGPSGVGKSSLIEKIARGGHRVEIGELSEKIGRGKHTTRHVELFRLEGDGYLADTPGFGNLALDEDMDVQELETLFPEFDDYREQCRFKGCLHINEPDCAVKDAIGGGISRERYQFYKTIHEEINNGIRR